MRPEYSQVYRTLYQRHWWWRARERVLVAELRADIPEHGWGNVLVGCGDGLFVDRIAEFGTPWGVEADPTLVSQEGPHRARISIRSFDSTFHPVPRFRLILMLDVLEHLKDLAAVPRSWVNAALYYLTIADVRGLRWAHLPFGSSLLAWCAPSVGQPERAEHGVAAGAAAGS